MNVLAGALAGGGDIYATDDDPELVAAAVPFGLKTIEALLAETPKHDGLLLAAASGFTQYGYAFVQAEADYVEEKDLARATALRARARKLYSRALRYGLRGLEVRHPGFEAGLRDDGSPREDARGHDEGRRPAPLLDRRGLGRGDLPLEGERRADGGPGARRGSRTDGPSPSTRVSGRGRSTTSSSPSRGAGPPAAGGSVGARPEHFERAVALSGGKRAAPYVSFAETVSVGAQNRAEFEDAPEEGPRHRPRRRPRAAARQHRLAAPRRLAPRPRRRALPGVDR